MKKMKKSKKLLVLLFTAAFAVFLPLMPANTLRASAAEPVTYVIRYMDSDQEWRFQVGSQWNNDAQHRELYYMQQDMKDGDYLVVDSNHGLNLTLSVRLGNLTVLNSTMAVVYAKGYDACYVLNGSAASINGDVANAYVYGDNTRCTFVNNVQTLEITNNNDNKPASPVVTCQGAVAHLILHDPYTDYHFYNIATGKLEAKEANIKTDAAFYSTEAPAATPAAPVATPEAPAAAAETPAATPAAPSSAYDDVPKTGDSNMLLILAVLSCACFLGSYAVKKSGSHS